MARAKHREPAELPAAGSDDWVIVYPEPGQAGPTAAALLQAARDLGLDEQRAVVSRDGGFEVPQAVLDATDLTAEAADAPE